MIPVKQNISGRKDLGEILCTSVLSTRASAAMAVARGILGRQAFPFSTVVTHSPKYASTIDSAASADHPLKSPALFARVPRVRAGGSVWKECTIPSVSLNLGNSVNFSTKSPAKGRRRGLFPMAAATSDTLSPAEEVEYNIQEQILAHQRAAAKLSKLEEARTMVHQTTLGTLSTISQRHEGFPVGSMVTYATDADGNIILCISTLSPHTRDLIQNSKCSLLVPKDPADKSDTVVTIVGEAVMVSGQEEATARAAYLKMHPGAFWVDFGDFKFVRIQPKNVRYVSGIVTGLAAVGDFTGEQYRATSVDPISQFGPAIAGHMNRDHADQTAQIVENSIGVKVDSALIQDVDKFGFGVLAKRQGRPVKLRIPFPRPAEDRKALKTLIIEMLTPKEGPKDN